MTTLRQKISALETEGAFIVTPHQKSEFGTVANAQLAGSETLPETVVVSLDDPVKLLTTIIALDGCVENLALISAGTPDEEISRRMQGSGKYLVVTEDASKADSISAAELLERFKPEALQQPTRWQLSTSGTTSVPKQVAHTFESLVRTTRVGSGSEYVWGELYDPCRFAGLQVIMQALLGGSTLVFPNPHDELADQLAFFKTNSVNSLSATPTLWRKILMTAGAEKLALRSITLGGEISDERVLKAVANAYPNAKVRHIYASTEAGTGFSVTDGLPGFPASYLEGGVPGVMLRIRDSTLMIHNPMVSRGYIGEENDFVDDDGFVNTGDSVAIEGDRVIFLGRSSGVINVGGNKVYPEKVEDKLLRVPGVRLARVYGQKNSIIGALVAAEIVIDTGQDQATVKPALMAMASKSLEKHERPVKYQFVDSIKHTANGKVQR